MATDARKHTAPAAAETPRRQAINDLSLSVNDFVPVANATERNTLGTTIAPTAARPLLVYRQDADAFEYSTDGTVWEAIGRAQKAAPLTTFSTAASAETLSGLSLTAVTRVGAEYELKFTGRVAATVADLRAGVRVRRGTTTSGTLIGEALVMPAVANTGQTVEYTCYDTAVATSTTWVVTTVTLGGTGNTNIQGSASAPATLIARRV